MVLVPAVRTQDGGRGGSRGCAGGSGPVDAPVLKVVVEGNAAGPRAGCCWAAGLWGALVRLFVF